MNEQAERLHALQRQNRMYIVESFDDYQRIAECGSNGSERDEGLIKAALLSLVADVLAVGGDLYINAGN